MTMHTSSGSQRRGPPPKAPSPLSLIIYMVSTALLITVLSSLVSGTMGRPVSYTEFKRLVRSDEVATVTVTETHIRGTLKKADENWPGLVEKYGK